MSIYRASLTVRSAETDDYSRLVKFITREPYVHRHLDWRSPMEWLGFQPFLIAEQAEEIEGVLACPPDPEGIAWMRLFAVGAGQPQESVFQKLIESAREQLSHQGRNRLVAIAIQEWFERLLVETGFIHPQDIVVLEWSGPTPEARPLPPAVIIRPMIPDDLPEVHDVDEQAFDPLWHNSLESLSLAYNQSAWSTVAETERGIIGYQISTAIHLSGHLARLAVIPSEQNHNVGYELVRDLLRHFRREDAWRVTVNTQSDNVHSLGLYKKLGFRPTGEKFPVFEWPSS